MAGDLQKEEAGEGKAFGFSSGTFQGQEERASSARAYTLMLEGCRR
jgi:hypothetical protein